MKTEKRTWSEEEIELLQTGATNREIAKRLKRSEASVRAKRTHLGIYSPESTPTTFVEDKKKADSSYWKEQHRLLMAKYDKALKQGSVVEQLVGLATELAPKSYDAAPPQTSFPKTKKSSAQSAVLLVSDCHVGQIVEPGQTLGYGRYDFPTFLARLKFLESGVSSILQGHTTTAIDELVVCFGGDMIDGALDHGAEVGQHSTLFEQVYGAGHAIAQFLRNLSRVVPKIRVYSTNGNHPRLPSQKRTPTDGRFSNFDLFLSSYVEALTKDLTSVKWTLDKQPFTIFDVQGFKFHLSHGDHLRGADRALGIPSHSVGRAISSTAQLFGKHDEESPHIFLTGHLHRSIVLPHAKGSFLVNGAFVGLDTFGLSCGFSPVDPEQLLFLMHPKYGRTATYNIQLKFAKVGVKPPYDLPKNFLPK